ncbi:AAA domain-containing protein [Paraphysoderma sedebokerense]|nr:AAA domain-containing protein [Paraphysoderma sedebokerense]
MSSVTPVPSNVGNTSSAAVSNDSRSQEPARYYINSLTTIEGNVIPLEPGQVTVFVGPNNAGKTTALKEIHWLMSQTCTIGQHMPIGDPWDADYFHPKLFKAYDYEKWCHQCNPVPYQFDDNIEISHQGNTFSLPKNTPPAGEPKDAIDKHIGTLSSLFSQYLSFSDRIDALRMNDAHDTYNEKPKTALQYIYSNKKRLERISDVLEKILGYKLCINREAGKFIRLHTYHGNPGQYEDIRKYSLVDDHGDGLKGVVGLLLSIFASPKLVHLIDEPEVFLHPPQSRELGKFISRTAKDKNIQFFLSTHDINFVLGLLDGGDNVNVIRVTRTFEPGSSTAALHTLNAELLKESWNDPLIKHTRALNGLFYDLVVLCEADGDCLIYSEAAKSFENEGRSILYVPTYGKQNFYKYYRIFINAGVPLTVIADIDILRPDDGRKKHPLLRLLDKDHTLIWKHMLKINNIVLGKRMAETETDSEVADVQFDPKPIGWEEVKRNGLKVFNDHEEAKMMVDTIERLKNQKKVKICVVKEGQLESFFPIDELHGPSWVIRFMEELQKARKSTMGMSGEKLKNSESGTCSKMRRGSETPRQENEGTSGKNSKNSKSAGIEPEKVLLAWENIIEFMKEVLTEEEEAKVDQI